MKNTRNLILCRSDCGDGGWSLHAPPSPEFDIDEDGPDLLIHGPAEWDSAAGAWDRPNADDYARAHSVLAERAEVSR